jgi:hypothetical protein
MPPKATAMTSEKILDGLSGRARQMIESRDMEIQQITQEAAVAILFLFYMFSHEGDKIQSWIDELQEQCPRLAAAVAALSEET